MFLDEDNRITAIKGFSGFNRLGASLFHLFYFLSKHLHIIQTSYAYKHPTDCKNLSSLLVEFSIMN